MDVFYIFKMIKNTEIPTTTHKIHIWRCHDTSNSVGLNGPWAEMAPYLFPTIYEIFQILLDFMKICIILIFFHIETYFMIYYSDDG